MSLSTARHENGVRASHNFFAGEAPLGEMLAFFSQPVFWRIAGAYHVAFDRKCTFGAKNGAEASDNFLKGAAPLGEMLAFFHQPVFGPPGRACRGTPCNSWGPPAFLGGPPHFLGTPRSSWGPPAFLGDPPQFLGTPRSSWGPPAVLGGPQT